MEKFVYYYKKLKNLRLKKKDYKNSNFFLKFLII